MLRRYAAGSSAGSGGLEMGSSGMEAGRPVLPLKPGDLSDALEVRALLMETKESCSSLSLWMEFLESLRLKMPIVTAGRRREAHGTAEGRGRGGGEDETGRRIYHSPVDVDLLDEETHAGRKDGGEMQKLPLLFAGVGNRHIRFSPLARRCSSCNRL